MKQELAAFWFNSIAELSSITKASEHLGIPASTLSRKLAKLERDLGIVLLERTTRSMHLTEAGKIFYRHCAASCQEFEKALNSVGKLQSTPRGVLQIASQYTLGSYYITQLLASFLERYKDIKIHLQMCDNPIEKLEKGTDIALHISNNSRLGYHYRKLGEAAMHLYASPKYLSSYGQPNHPCDLNKHIILAQQLDTAKPSPPLTWVLTNYKNKQKEIININPSLISNEAIAGLNTALAGHGIFLGTPLITKSYLDSGELLPVLPNWYGPILEFQAVFATREGLAPKSRVFIDFLVEHLSERLR